MEPSIQPRYITNGLFSTGDFRMNAFGENVVTAFKLPLALPAWHGN
jgi:hypothetical protein